jgi:hypothetical protein
MSEEKSFVKDFKNIDKPKEKDYVNAYIEKTNIDPLEKEKINKIKIKQALKKFSKDNLID